MKIVTTEQMRALEQRSEARGVSVDTLMENAGLAVARCVARLLGEARGKRVLVLVGPGNNGGDGLVAARHLSDWGSLVTLYMCTYRRGEPSKFQVCQARRIPVVAGEEDAEQGTLRQALDAADLVLDAVFGTGRPRPFQGTMRTIFQRLAEAREQRPALRLVALDLPSGLHSDTGEVDPLCPSADVTVTLGAPKIGLFCFPGAERVGALEITDIGIPPGLDDDVDLELLDPPLVRALLPRRPISAHKGTFGRVLVVAGSRNYVGAPYLACAAAYRAGAGLVTLATPASVYSLVASRLTEATYLPLPETEAGTLGAEAVPLVRDALAGCDAAVIGCGLGHSEATLQFIQQVLLTEPAPSVPVVLDADALNCLADAYQWWERLKAHAVLTPHPGEMGRLLGCGIAAVQRDRLATARDASTRWGQAVLLKGAFSVIVAPGRPTRLSPFANPALASGGTGDVLAGLVGGFMAQGLCPYDATCCAVYVHGRAGERWSEGLGEAGLLAGELLDEAPAVLRELRQV